MTDDETLERIVEEAKSAIFEAKLQNPKKAIGFMIGTTGAKEDIQTPYRMPVRQTDDWILFGVVVFSQSQAIVAAHLMDGLVDTIFVDSEKKLPVRFEPDHSLLAKYGIETKPQIPMSNSVTSALPAIHLFQRASTTNTKRTISRSMPFFIISAGILVN